MAKIFTGWRQQESYGWCFGGYKQHQERYNGRLYRLQKSKQGEVDVFRGESLRG